jgi:predicted ATPase
MSAQDQGDASRPGICCISIENFKGIGKRVEIPIRPITLLFGANSSGKSTVLQAMDILREIATGTQEHGNGSRAELSCLRHFRSLVHKHELERCIRLEVDIVTGEDGVPMLEDILGFSPIDPLGVTNQLRDVFASMRGQLKSDGSRRTFSRLAYDDVSTGLTEYLAEYDISRIARRLTVGVSIKWDAVLDKAFVAEYIVGVNGAQVARIAASRANSGVSIPEVNFAHPMLRDLFPVEASDSSPIENPFQVWCELLQESGGEIPLPGCFSVFPDTRAPLPLGRSDLLDALPDAPACRHVLNQILLGPAKLLLDAFSPTRRIGPLRLIPSRNAAGITEHGEDVWEDGSAAWHILRSHYDPESGHGDTLVREVSRNLSETARLGLGYSIDVAAHRVLAEDSDVVAALKLLRTQYEERDQAFFLSNVGKHLDSLPIKPEIVITDLRTDVEVEPEDVGAGVCQVLPVVVGVLEPNSKVVVIEQPELHVHPSVQCALGDLFIRAVRANENRRFILETHSPHLLLRMMKRVRQNHTGQMESPDLDAARDDLSVVLVECRDGETSFRAMPVSDRGDFVKAWPGGFFEEDFGELF